MAAPLVSYLLISLSLALLLKDSYYNLIFQNKLMIMLSQTARYRISTQINPANTNWPVICYVAISLNKIIVLSDDVICDMVI